MSPFDVSPTGKSATTEPAAGLSFLLSVLLRAGTSLCKTPATAEADAAAGRTIFLPDGFLRATGQRAKTKRNESAISLSLSLLLTHSLSLV